MATFEGSVQEFHHYIGPRIRNRIQSFARQERNARNGVCEDCGKTDQELHSAHLHGKDRRTIIEAVLSRYESNGLVRCDVGIVEFEIVTEHGDVRDTFKFLCNECHVIYDNKNSAEIFIPKSAPQSSRYFDRDKVEIEFLQRTKTDLDRR